MINVSNGHLGAAEQYEIDAVRYALSKDAVVVAGVGNTGQGMLDVISPASIPGVVAVSGADKDGNFWSGSAKGPQVVVNGPAVQLPCATPPAKYPNGYGIDEGTSLATAVVSGIVALIRAKYPQLNAANVINRLIKTARDNGDPGRDPLFGFGTVRAYQALTDNVPPVDSNPAGNPPAATGTAGSSAPASAGGSHGRVSSTGRLVLIMAGVVVVALVVVVVAVARSGRSRRTPPGPPPGGYPATGPTVSYPRPAIRPPSTAHHPRGFLPGTPHPPAVEHRRSTDRRGRVGHHRDDAPEPHTRPPRTRNYLSGAVARVRAGDSHAVVSMPTEAAGWPGSARAQAPAGTTADAGATNRRPPASPQRWAAWAGRRIATGGPRRSVARGWSATGGTSWNW